MQRVCDAHWQGSNESFDKWAACTGARSARAPFMAAFGGSNLNCQFPELQVVGERYAEPMMKQVRPMLGCLLWPRVLLALAQDGHGTVAGPHGKPMGLTANGLATNEPWLSHVADLPLRQARAAALKGWLQTCIELQWPDKRQMMPCFYSCMRERGCS